MIPLFASWLTKTRLSMFTAVTGATSAGFMCTGEFLSAAVVVVLGSCLHVVLERVAKGVQP